VREWGLSFPYGTLTINLLGSLVVGFFMIWTTEGVLADPRWRPLVVVGSCRAFTTFSSYAFGTMSLFERGRWGLALADVFGSNLLCLSAAFGGHGTGEGAVKWQALWRSKSRFI
jgi:fluoride exporter